MVRPSVIILLLASLYAGTAAAQSSPSLGSISGRVIDAATGLPVPDIDVRFEAASAARFYKPGVETKTDAAGRFKLSVAPGTGVLSAGMPGPAYVSRPLTLDVGEDLTSIDLRMPAWSGISGRVLDGDKAPIPGIGVYLTAREYLYGSLRYVVNGATATDERGRYKIEHLEPGRGYLLMVWRSGTKLDAISSSPSDPVSRKSATAAVFFPGTSAIEAASMLILQPGEVREGLDVTLPAAQSPSFCIDGKAWAVPNSGPIDFQIGPSEPVGREFQAPSREGKTGPDGLFRICDLTPGSWRISARQGEPSYPQFYGEELVYIADADVHDVVVAVRPRISVPGEVVWDGAPPNKAVDAKINVGLNRIPTYGVTLPVTPSLPGEFSLGGFLTGDYAATVWGLQDGMYVKDLNYGDQSVLRETFRVGSSDSSARLRVSIARDGGFIQAKATDKDNNPLAGCWIIIVPVAATSEAMVAASYTSGRTNQSGVWKSDALAPGKYYVLSSGTPPDRTPETIARIMVERLRGNPADVGPGNVTMVVVETD